MVDERDRALRELLASTTPDTAPPDLDALVRRARRPRRFVLAGTVVAATVAVALVAVGVGDGSGPEIVDAPPTTTPTDLATEEAVPLPELPDGTVEEVVAWRIVERSPDGRLLLLRLDGEVCATPRRVEVRTSDDGVDLRVFAAVSEVCTFGGATGTSGDTPAGDRDSRAGPPLGPPVVVELRTPVAAQDLTGCGGGACGAVVAEDPLAVLDAAVPVLPVVLATESGATTGLDPQDGTAAWTRDLGQDLTTGVTHRGDVVLLHDADTIRRIDPSTGEEVWSTSDPTYGPYGGILTDEIALVQDRVVFDVVHAIDLADGRLAWSVDLGDDVVVTTIVTTDSGDVLVGTAEGGGGRVRRLDPATGEEIGGFAVRGNACEGVPEPCSETASETVGDLLAAVGDQLVTRLLQPAVVQVRELDGAVVGATPTAGTARVVAADDELVVVIDDRRTVVVDDRGRTRWELPSRSAAIAVTPAVVAVVGDDGRVAGHDRTDGAVVWRLEASAPPAVVGGEADVVIRTTSMLLGVAGATGDVVWWAPLPVEGGRVPVERRSRS